MPVEMARAISADAADRGATISGWLREAVRAFLYSAPRLDHGSDERQWISYREDHMLIKLNELYKTITPEEIQ